MPSRWTRNWTLRTSRSVTYGCCSIGTGRRQNGRIGVRSTSTRTLLPPTSAMPRTWRHWAVSTKRSPGFSRVTEAADNAVRLADSPTVITTTASALARIGQRTEARQLLNRSLALARERYVCRFIVAATYVDLGEPEQAFESLERAYLQRST
jgi:predicted Zn-dependent protease